MDIGDFDYDSSEEDAARKISAARGMIDPREREATDRIVRAEAARASMTSREWERYETFETRFQIELARRYGDRLSDIITKHLTQTLVLDHRAIQKMAGIENDVPRNANQWRVLVEEITERDELAKLNLNHSDAEAKAELRRQIMNRLGRAKRISMARAGTLDNWLSEQVADTFERHAGPSWRQGAGALDGSPYRDVPERMD